MAHAPMSLAHSSKDVDKESASKELEDVLELFVLKINNVSEVYASQTALQSLAQSLKDAEEEDAKT